MDARAALEYLLQRSDIDRRKIVLFGRSVGAFDFLEENY